MIFLRKYRFIVFGFLFLLSISPFFIEEKDLLPRNVVNEVFNKDLIHINSIDKAFNYVDSICFSYKTPVFDTLKYIQTVSRFTKEKFHYGLSKYSIKDNWIAFLAGKFLWSHLSAIVNPDDIIQHSEGLCSQQTIVFMELLKRRGIKVRSVGMGYEEGPGHFLAEVNYNGNWHLYDVTKEPAWSKLVKHHHESMEYYINNKDSLYLVYQDIYDRISFDKLTAQVSYGTVDEYPARNMLLFHYFTKFLTYFFSVVFLLLFIMSFKTKNRNIVVEELNKKININENVIS